MTNHLIDASHTVEDGMITYKSFPAPVSCDWLSREASRTKYSLGTEFQIGKIEMIGNTGTYIDGPFHRYENGKDFSAGAALVGIDSFNIDSSPTASAPSTQSSSATTSRSSSTCAASQRCRRRAGGSSPCR